MALSYGLTNPAAFKKGEESEPTPIGYKIYVGNGNGGKESSDFGLTWNNTNYSASSTIYKYGLVYDPVNNKVVIINSYSPYSGTALYSFYATPTLNGSTTFTRGTQRTKSPQGSSSSSSRYLVYGSVFDYETNSIIGVREDRYHNYSTTPNYDYFINSNYLSPNTFASVALPNLTGSNKNIVTGKNGINLEIQRSSNGHQANVFRFVKNSDTSYSKTIIASISESTLNISTSNYYVQAAYLKDVGFVIYYCGFSGNAYSRLIRFDGTLSGTKNWGTQKNFAFSSNNYYSSRVYLARGDTVYYTTDGTNWKTCSGKLPSSLGTNGVVIVNTDDNIAVLLNSDGYWAVSTNGGTSFVKSTGNVSNNKWRAEACSDQSSQYLAILVPVYA